MLAPLRASISATSWGVDTIKAPKAQQNNFLLWFRKQFITVDLRRGYEMSKKTGIFRYQMKKKIILNTEEKVKMI